VISYLGPPTPSPRLRLLHEGLGIGSAPLARPEEYVLVAHSSL
jgi:hypothetical protein